MTEWKPRFHYAWHGLLDIIYPPHCLICGRDPEPVVCEKCYAAFTPLPEPVCAVCGRPNEGNAPCRDCAEAANAGGWGFDAARAAGVFAGALREGILRLKYESQELLGEPLGAFLAERCVTDSLLTAELRHEIDAIMPVPLHRSRERKRGFNQAQLLAIPLAAQMDLPLWTHIVQRARKTAQQAAVSGADARRKNINAGDFAVPDPRRIAGKGVLLVDDVFTTGTTISACAAALKAAGARKVIAVTLAAGQ